MRPYRTVVTIEDPNQLVLTGVPFAAGERVEVVVVPRQAKGENPSHDAESDENVARQKAAHEAIRAKLKGLVRPQPDDGLTGSVDHDEILYGWRKER